MRTFRFDKLVRDKIPEDQRRNGANVTVRELNDIEYIEALKTKLIEESQEIDSANPDEAAGELADLQEVVDCLAKALGIDKNQIAELQSAKCEKAGSFVQRLYVETAEVPDDNPWIGHYLANPDRYPEI